MELSDFSRGIYCCVGSKLAARSKSWIFLFCVYVRRDVETLTDHQLLLDALEKWVFVLVFSSRFSALLKSPPSVCSSEAETSTGDLGAILNTEQPAEG